MTPSQAAYLAALVEKGCDQIGAETDPLKARSIVDSFVVNQIRKSWRQSELDSLASMDIQSTMDLNPRCPRVPELVNAGSPGVFILTSQNVATSAEVARMMEANNEQLLAAMKKIIAEQNAPKE